jgi:hypothetical protein
VTILAPILTTFSRKLVSDQSVGHLDHGEVAERDVARTNLEDVAHDRRGGV